MGRLLSDGEISKTFQSEYSVKGGGFWKADELCKAQDLKTAAAVNAEWVEEYAKLVEHSKSELAARDKEWAAGVENAIKFCDDKPCTVAHNRCSFGFYHCHKWEQLKKDMGVSQ